MKKVLNVALLVIVAALIYANFGSVTSPLKFEDDRLKRDNVVIDRLIDIRTAQVEYRAQNGKYAATFDELIKFLEGRMEVVNKNYLLNDLQLQLVRDFKIEDTNPADKENMTFSEDEADRIVLNLIADSKNDSKQAKRNIAISRLKKLDDLYKSETAPGLKIAKAFRRDTTYRAYVDTLFHNVNYNLQQLRYIPFSDDGNGRPVEFYMKADSIQTSSVNKAGGYIPVFEARADFIQYLQGLNKQELDNYLLQVKTKGTEFREELILDKKTGEPMMGDNGPLKNRIPCRKVGDVTKNNNNAGNWPNR